MTTPLLVVALCGAVLVTAALTWLVTRRAVKRRQAVFLIDRALSHADPAVRSAAITVMTKDGLHQYGGLLLEHARRERHPAVVVHLVRAVARNQWEPHADANVGALSEWARAVTEVGARSAWTALADAAAARAQTRGGERGQEQASHRETESGRAARRTRRRRAGRRRRRGTVNRPS